MGGPGVTRLRLASITGVIGLNGAGKGLVAAEGALRAWEQGHPVVSNIRLMPEAAGFAADLYLPLQSWRDIASLGVIRCNPLDCPDHDEETSHPERSLTGGVPCTLWLDEINACFPARQFAALPPELVRVINQLRKQKVTVVWTSPAWEQADAELRRVTRMVVMCRGRLADSWQRRPGRLGWFPPVQRNEDGKRILTGGDWPPNRLFRFEGFKAEDLEGFALDRRTEVRAQWGTWYWRQKHRAQFVYNTDAQVDLLDHLDFAGVCVACDGKRSRHACKCKTAPAASAAASEAGGAAAPSHLLASS